MFFGPSAERDRDVVVLAHVEEAAFIKVKTFIFGNPQSLKIASLAGTRALLFDCILPIIIVS